MKNCNQKFGITLKKLKPEVKEKLNEIAEAFIEYAEIPKEGIKDIVITGSTANYNYTPYSDLDLAFNSRL